MAEIKFEKLAEVKVMYKKVDPADKDKIAERDEEISKIKNEMDAIYAKEDFSEADGVKAGELGAEFEEMGGWNAESEAATFISIKAKAASISVPVFNTSITCRRLIAGGADCPSALGIIMLTLLPAVTPKVSASPCPKTIAL